MIYALPGGASIAAVLSNAPTGLVGTLGVQILDSTGAPVVARTTAGIVEKPVGSGEYIATLTAPVTVGSYIVFWDHGIEPGATADEELIVTLHQPGVFAEPPALTVTPPTPVNVTVTPVAPVTAAVSLPSSLGVNVTPPTPVATTVQTPTPVTAIVSAGGGGGGTTYTGTAPIVVTGSVISLSPAMLSTASIELAAGTYNNWAAPTAGVITVTGTGKVTLTGMTGGVEGEIRILRYMGSGELTLSHEALGSTEANRLYLGSKAAFIVTAGDELWFVYKDGRWTSETPVIGSNSIAAGQVVPEAWPVPPTGEGIAAGQVGAKAGIERVVWFAIVLEEEFSPEQILTHNLGTLAAGVGMVFEGTATAEPAKSKPGKQVLNPTTLFSVQPEPTSVNAIKIKFATAPLTPKVYFIKVVG